MNSKSKILVLGGTGMVGSSILNKLKEKGYKNILHPTRKELNLYKKTKVMKYLKLNNPEFVLLCAARVGGIAANDQFNHEFLIQNIAFSRKRSLLVPLLQTV